MLKASLDRKPSISLKFRYKINGSIHNSAHIFILMQSISAYVYLAIALLKLISLCLIRR